MQMIIVKEQKFILKSLTLLKSSIQKLRIKLLLSENMYLIQIIDGCV